MERDGAFCLGERAGDLRAAIVAGKAAAGLRHAASCLSMIVAVKVAIPLGSGQQCAGSQGGNDSVQRIMDRVTEMEFRHANDATTEE